MLSNFINVFFCFPFWKSEFSNNITCITFFTPIQQFYYLFFCFFLLFNCFFFSIFFFFSFSSYCFSNKYISFSLSLITFPPSNPNIEPAKKISLFKNVLLLLLTSFLLLWKSYINITSQNY